MPLAFPNVKYRSGDQTVATAVTLPVFSAPFPGVNIDYVLTQDFQQIINDFVPLALDTAHPDNPDFLLAQESEKRDLGGGVVQWTRTYLKLPAEYVEPRGNYAYNFIGFSGIVNVTPTSTEIVTGRLRFTQNVPVQVTRSFFNTANPDADIPEVELTRYYYGSTSTLDVDYLADSPPFTEATTPSRTDYDALVAAAAFNLVVENSTLTRWMGNFWIRETMRIKAR